MKIRLPAKLFRAGDYPDKKYRASGDDLDRIVAATRGAAGSPPMDLHHADTDNTFDLGSVPAASVRREGDWILGDVEVEDTDLPRFKSRGLSVKINRATSAIDKVTVTGSPRILGAGFSDDGEADGDALEFDGGYLMDPKDVDTTPAEATSAEGQVLTEEQAEGLFKRMLRKMFGGDEPAANLSTDDADAKLTELEQRLTAKFEADRKADLAKIEALEKQSANFSDDRVATEVSAAIVRGVPPIIAENLIPLAFGRDGVTFSDDAGEQTRTVAEAAKLVLEFAGGKIPQGGKLRQTSGQETVDFDTRSAERAKQLAEEKGISFAEAQRMADSELNRKEA